MEQHKQNTDCQLKTVVADYKYGTAENFVACHRQGVVTHLGDAQDKRGKVEGIFGPERFEYQSASDTYVCPAGQRLRRRRYIRRQRVWEYGADKAVCAGCALRTQCTRSKVARVVSRHEAAEVLKICRQQAHSAAARQDRRRRQYLIEGSFADAANNHGFKRARWRRLWRQQIQDYLIAAIQNIRILLARAVLKPAAGAALVLEKAIRLKLGWCLSLRSAPSIYHVRKQSCGER